MAKFKAGDKVKIEGILEIAGVLDYPLKLKIGDTYFSFTTDGKLYMDDDSSSLILVEPAMVMVKKWKWVVKSEEYYRITNYRYSNFEEYMEKYPNSSCEFIQRVEGTEIEVEE